MLDRVVQKCLAKDPDRRWRSARDLADELKWIREGTHRADILPYGARRLVKRERLAWTVVGLAAGALLTFALLWSWPWSPLTPLSNRPIRRETIPLPAAGRLALGNILPGEASHRTVAFSPDGNHLVYVVDTGRTTQLYLRSMDEFEAAPIAGTEGAFQPFFSPDGGQIGFFTQGKLKKVFLRGGEPVILCDAARVWGATWAPDGTIFFSPNEGGNLARVSAEGGLPQIVAQQQGRRAFLWPDVLPGGQAVVLTSYAKNRRQQIELLVLATGERRILLQTGACARYVPTGHIVYLQEGDLLAVPFDLTRLQVTGPPAPILVGVRTELYGAGQFAFAGDGTLAYIAGSFAAKGRLVWVDRRGAIEPLPVQAQQYGHFSLSPDGRLVAVQITTTNTDIWLFDLVRASWSRLTTEGTEVCPIWTPDGKRIVFTSSRAGPANLFWQFADGGGPAERIVTSKNRQFPMSFSPDGKLLSIIEFDPATDHDTWLLPMDGVRRPQPVVRTRFNDGAALFSPDGQWLAYQSDESGRQEIYVQPYPATGERWPISTDGGMKPIGRREVTSCFMRTVRSTWLSASYASPRSPPASHNCSRKARLSTSRACLTPSTATAAGCWPFARLSSRVPRRFVSFPIGSTS